MKTIICDICKKQIWENGVEVKRLEAKKYKIFGMPRQKHYDSNPMDICERCMDKLEDELTKGE